MKVLVTKNMTLEEQIHELVQHVKSAGAGNAEQAKVLETAQRELEAATGALEKLKAAKKAERDRLVK